jgi:molybdopterin molybdotransferase
LWGYLDVLGIGQRLFSHDISGALAGRLNAEHSKKVAPMHKPFLRVHSLSEAQELLLGFNSLDTETVDLDDASFRVLAEPLTAPEDLPEFDRSTMDGFAVRASDTFGATESTPGMLSILGEVLMGELPDFSVKKGDAARIWTGGALPKGTDAVIMVEHTDLLDENTIEIAKAVAPFDNVVRRGEDFKKGEVLLNKGRRLLPQDVGLMAAMGRTTVTVYRKPVVGLISSGDEVVPIDRPARPGCVRDVNRYTLSAMIRESHAHVAWIGIAPDRLDALSSLMDRALAGSDIVVISGGSSMGSRDHVIEAIQAYADAHILLHGVSVSPGKPLILASVRGRPVVGLPGHPVSAMVCQELFVTPLIRRIEGEETSTPFLRPTFKAVLGRNCPSREGRTDFVRVRLHRNDHTIVAMPVPGKSGMISSMVRAHGFVRIESDCEGLYKGDAVTVNLFAPWLEEGLEKEHLSGHEAAGGSSGHLFESSRQERLSRV